MDDRGSGENGRRSERADRSRHPFVRERREAEPSATGPVTIPEICSDDLMIVGMIAEDRRGKVVHAYDQLRRRHVAVKQLFGPVSAKTEARFRREALLPARLRHPGIVDIIGFGRWPNGDPFFAMELIHGIELNRLLDQATTLRERLPLLRHVTACAEAIAVAHAERIIHRDIKPENVLISNRGQAVLIDWGIAKDLLRREKIGDSELLNVTATVASKTGAGRVLGTPAYMPPEQARGAYVDERADVYALGAVLLHVLTGEAPYPGDDAQAIVEQVLEGPPPTLAKLSASLRPELVAVVRRALSRDPDERFADGDALARALHELAL
ncbi:MAG: serine/threonine-protein kinase [Nannocystaceae bacterium]